ncbi:MAG: four helix bundle protein [Verrucomicrobia bacterium]|nr:four helix bundle protein [Verrucomicrobiota bacterium]
MKNGEKPTRDLRERTFRFARQVIKLFVSLDRGVLAQTPRRQMLRSGTSAGANYREADQARSKAECIAKIGDCLNEADETSYWLDLMSAENIGSPNELALALDPAGQMVAILTTIKRHAEGKE